MAKSIYAWSTPIDGVARHPPGSPGLPFARSLEVHSMFAYTWPLLNLFWTFLTFAGSSAAFFIIWCSSTTSAGVITTAWPRPAGRC